MNLIYSLFGDVMQRRLAVTEVVGECVSHLEGSCRPL